VWPTNSTVNHVISKRMVKKRQMRRTQRGAHLPLQVRTQVLNDDLRHTFERWYRRGHRSRKWLLAGPGEHLGHPRHAHWWAESSEWGGAATLVTRRRSM
jgi:hypothetical protein